MGAYAKAGDRAEASALARRARIMRYYLKGNSAPQIARHLGVDVQTVQVALSHAMRERREEHAMLADFSTVLMLDQLDQLMRAHFDRALGDVKHADLVLKILDRRAKLLGLNAPDRLQVSVRSQLDDEIATLIDKMKTHAAEQGVEVDTPILDAVTEPIDE